MDEKEKQDISMDGIRNKNVQQWQGVPLDSALTENMKRFDEILQVKKNYDILKRVFLIGKKEACFYFIDGFHKDMTMQKLLQYFGSITEQDTPQTMEALLQKYMPYGEIEKVKDVDEILGAILSGKPALFIDGFAEALTIDFRDYPARGVTEPDMDKAMRG